MSKYCSRCGTELNDDAIFCNRCGNKVAENHIETSYHHSDFACPRCHSENIQSLPIIYQSGSSGTNAITAADKFIAVTKGNTMTDLARSVAPPTKKEENWWPTFVFGALAYIGFENDSTILGLIGGLLAVGGFYSIYEIDNYNKNVFPVEYDNWQNSYLCHRCGNVFRIN